MTYFDISCPECGPYHLTLRRAPETCINCGTHRITALPHDFEIDQRFKSERKREDEE